MVYDQLAAQSTDLTQKGEFHPPSQAARIAGEGWTPLPIDEEIAVLGNIYQQDPEPEDSTEDFAPLKSITPYIDTDPPRSGYSQQRVQSRLPHDEGFEKDPPEIGDWPRRLLHVPSMVSMKWSPGDVYFHIDEKGQRTEHRKPRYRAISYTWGRYAFGFGTEKWMKGKALAIANTDWRIPPIDPQYFTVGHFESIIRTSCKRLAGKPEVEFLWLDVACINQNDGISEKTLEIGRQASIFRNADMVMIWLHQQSTQKLKTLLNELVPPIPDLALLKRALDTFLADKWFSSLWTYQEAYLSQDNALFASKTGYVIDGISLGDVVKYCAAVVSKNGRSFTGIGKRNASQRISDSRIHQLIYTLLEKKGLLALSKRSPFALYGATWTRQTRFDWDRVYSIQQIFPLRVGTSVQGSDPHAKYDRVTLEAQLGRLMLERFPVECQLHVFDEPVEEGRGWHLSPSSHVPDFGLEKPLSAYNIVSCCSWTAIDDRDMVRACFEGFITDFESLQQEWTNADLNTRGLGGSDCEGTFSIALDAQRGEKELTPGELAEYRTWGYRRDLSPGEDQGRLARWLGRTFNSNKLCILLLGQMIDDDVERIHCGLLLISNSSDKKRIGVCLWKGRNSVVENNCSNGSIWRKETGHFN